MHLISPHLAKRLCALGLLLCVSTTASSESPLSALPAAADDKQRLPLDQLRAFTESLQRIKQTYIEPVSDALLLENAIQGMLDNLDPHSSYLKPDDYRSLEESTSGEFDGLGFELSHDNGEVKVITPIDNTPAQRAGIRPGDLIIKINGTPVRGLSTKKTTQLLRGKPGDSIDLLIEREGLDSPLRLTLVHETIRLESVQHSSLERGFGYLRISQFQTDTGEEVLKSMRSLAKAQGKSPLHGLVLDLRNNPGGSLLAAVDVCDVFLTDSLIVSTRGRLPEANVGYRAKLHTAFAHVPMVVLINGGSASSSEIVAGALQDHRRAIIVGTRSFGKGSVQSVFPLQTDTKKALKLTTALYYTPNGRSIQAEGIKPDIVVDKRHVEQGEAESGYREANLSGHLSGLQHNAGKEKRRVTEQGRSALDLSDYQLSQALNILKGLRVAKQKENQPPARKQGHHYDNDRKKQGQELQS